MFARFSGGFFEPIGHGRGLVVATPKTPPVLDRQLLHLPSKTIYCKRCVNSSQRPRLIFDQNGICDACRFSEHKHSQVNWEVRQEELAALLEKHRSQDGSFDVVVPASGGKDSCYVAHQLKFLYGMHPLCVVWAPAMYTDIGKKNLENFSRLFDTVLYTPNRAVHGKLTRLGFELFGDPFQPWNHGQQAYPVHIAIKYGIPLVFYGENQDAEYGGGRAKGQRAVETLGERMQNEAIRDPRGVDALVAEGHSMGVFSDQESQQPALFDLYRLPDPKAVADAGVENHFYSYYKRWIPQENFYYAQEHCGFELNPERSEGTYSKHSSLDDKIDGLHYYMQYIKFGFGRCTTEACHEIRDGFLSRDEAVALVRRFDGEFPKKYHEACLDYMGISEAYFWQVVDRFRPKHIWEQHMDGWRLRYSLI